MNPVVTVDGLLLLLLLSRRRLVSVTAGCWQGSVAGMDGEILEERGAAMLSQALSVVGLAFPWSLWMVGK